MPLKTKVLHAGVPTLGVPKGIKLLSNPIQTHSSQPLSLIDAIESSRHEVKGGKKTKKGFASLRLCVSSLHRDHANLLCIFKRLFDATTRR